MKKIAIIVVVAICLLVFSYQYIFSKAETVSPLAEVLQNTSSENAKPSIIQEKSESLFVPYWSFTTKAIDTKGFDTAIYFGITANTNGIDKTESGYTKLGQFTKLLPTDTKKLLTVRMIDSEINSKVLDSKQAQEKIITESIVIAKENGFSGIVFDFEINALAFPSVVSNITQFYKSFYTATKKEGLSFHITIYGDVFYRARPYDVKEIAKYTDSILIMAYDFHKSRGNPGPNFPLSGKETYGYDMQKMLADFGDAAPMEKLVIVFGFFGYDWEVNAKNEGVKNGEPLSYLEMKKYFIDDCFGKACEMKRDSKSSETTITYTDNEGKPHIVWFEDMESVQKKKNFLTSKGINATSIWAYSYY